MALAMGKKVVLKKVRDLAATLAVLGVLFGLLMAINPRVREQLRRDDEHEGHRYAIRRSGP